MKDADGHCPCVLAVPAEPGAVLFSLDEVDAPLDDANTVRFCEMVKRMSDKTQFLFISHNKIAMEMGNQLVGVTMQEFGVSRIVEVDMEEALQVRRNNGGSDHERM